MKVEAYLQLFCKDYLDKSICDYNIDWTNLVLLDTNNNVMANDW